MMLVGCDQINGVRAEATVTTKIVHTGRGDVTCAVFLPNDGGGIDCDWEHPQ